MRNRHERRKATTQRKKDLKATTLDQHFEETLRRVRTEFERTGGLYPRFECLTDRERFHVPAGWPDGGKAADYPESRDGYRESAHKDSPACAALASSNCAYPNVR